jgi:glycosyltransferase involved in cell wall biosynthesis
VRVVHIVATNSFAGVERYVCSVARESTSRGMHVTVVGGDSTAMSSLARDGIDWLPGPTLTMSARRVLRLQRPDILHVHMTKAEAVGLIAGVRFGSPVVSTRHFAERRGANRLGTIAGVGIGVFLDHQIAISHFVDSRLERRADSVILNGVPSTPNLFSLASRNILVMQRLEEEKQTGLALRAWHESGLASRGWNLRIAGVGRCRSTLERHAVQERIDGVTFVGFIGEVQKELQVSGMLLATAPAEPFGLSVVEAMAAGIPVVAAAGGAHLETLGIAAERGLLFAPGNWREAASRMRELATNIEFRGSASNAVRKAQQDSLGIGRHVDQLSEVYVGAVLGQAGLRGRRSRSL